MRSIRLILLGLFAAAPLLAQPQATAANAYPTPGTGMYTATYGIEYAFVRGHHLLMDMYLPDGPGPHPTILYLHTGAWISGDRDPGASLRQASRGYAVASIDYELAPESTWPAQIEDCKAAVRWLRANAARYHLDPDRIGVFGASSGGHLAAVLGTSSGVPELEGPELGNAGYSSSVKVVVDFYGPTDLLKLDEQKLPCIPLDANEWYLPPSLLMGCPIQQCREKTETANPIHYITKGAPPFLIMHGALDCLVPWQQSALLYDALRSAGVYATFHLLLNAKHADQHFDELQNQQIVSDFFDKYLRGPELPARRRSARH